MSYILEAIQCRTLASRKSRGSVFNCQTTMEYTFARDGVAEVVTPERWSWGCVYKNGTELKQFGDNGVFHQFKEIEQEEVTMFVMYKLDNPDVRIDTIVDSRTQIFHFYRNLVLNMATEDERTVRVYVFGTKNTITGAMQYNYILPDGRILQANHDLPDLIKYSI